MQIYTKKYFVNFLSIILNAHNDPCFEDKSSSFTFSNKAVCEFYSNIYIQMISYKKYLECTLFQCRLYIYPKCTQVAKVPFS